MPRLTRPSPTDVDRILALQAKLDFTYPDVGATRGTLPRGWTVDYHRMVLGNGLGDFARAKQALREWAQFRLGWIDLDPKEAPIVPGSVVAVVARGAFLWWINAARIIYVIDEPDRFGFGYGTLPHHIARGEERFLVGLDPSDGSVWFDLLAFSTPKGLLSRIGYPFVRRYQHQFAEHSMEAMRRAVKPVVEGERTSTSQ